VCGFVACCIVRVWPYVMCRLAAICISCIGGCSVLLCFRTLCVSSYEVSSALAHMPSFRPQAAGIEMRARQRRGRGIDYGKEVPFEAKPAAGFYDISGWCCLCGSTVCASAPLRCKETCCKGVVGW
jgi:hypothetical protein